MTLGWINEALATLPGVDDALFQKVWSEKRLLFDGKQGVGDTVDYHSACLVAAALRRGGRLALILPDFQPHRPAFLFSTAMIRHFLDSRRPNGTTTTPRRGPVLYFGSTVGIRDQLRRTSVLGLEMNLADVFSQQDVYRGATGLGRTGLSTCSVPESLPWVVTVYAPADPVAVLQAYRPCWISIDIGDASSLPWLHPLLDETARQKLPIIAWGQNPLSDCVNDLADNCQTFTWPPTIQSQGCLPHELNDEPDALLYSSDSVCLSPLVLHGKSVDSFSDALRDAEQILGRTTQQLALLGRFGKDVVLVHWKFARALEALAVPFDFYEAEAQRFWGLQSFDKLTAVCDHFRSACMQSDPLLYSNLEEVAVLLNNAKAEIETHGCALWESLANLCIEDPMSDEARILVFGSDSKKRLFLFAMLARYNITEDDLRELQTYVVSLNDLRRWINSIHSSSKNISDDSPLVPSINAVWHPVLVGLPSPKMTPRLLYTFLYPHVDIMLYPHQCPPFMRRQTEWSVRLGGNITRNIEALANMSQIVAPPNGPASRERISVESPVEMNVETIKKTKSTFTGLIWTPADPVAEVKSLFQYEDDSEGEELVLKDQPDVDTSTTTAPSEDLWCTEAIRVQFDQGWHAYFAPDDVINVVISGGLDQRYIRSLNGQERILVIHGQQRQSLYDLIISRVHKHPSIELHLAMIRRWQEDLRVAYEQWSNRTGDQNEIQMYGKHDLDGLLRRMNAQGSQLVSSLTLSFWLKGYVLCPLEPEDLRRIAEILNMGFVQSYYKRIVQAASRLRGLHRGLSNRLNRWLQDQVSGGLHRNDDDVIDVELGLAFGDVRNSLMVLRIENIETVTGPFLRSNLGRVEKDA
jgi:hypothetical protein